MKSSKKEESGYRIIDGIVKGRASAIWYTNLDISKRYENLGLIEKYPKYDNYNVIEVAKVVDIPCIMMALWRPISFMDKFNPDQFKIIGCPDYTGVYGSDYIGISRIGKEWIDAYKSQSGRGHIIQLI